MLRLALALMLLAAPLPAEDDVAGAFDYYVLALSWTPNWCRIEGDARDAPRCDETGEGWSLHGLWPQYESGWPDHCPTRHRNPSRADTAAQASLFGSGGAAWHQWNKHGRCSGLSATDYYRLSELAYGSVVRPEVFRELAEPVRLPASVVEEAFIEANPEFTPDMLTVTCRDGHIQEVRLCLTRDLEPRVCGTDVMRDCALGDAYLAPLR